MRRIHGLVIGSGRGKVEWEGKFEELGLKLEGGTVAREGEPQR